MAGAAAADAQPDLAEINVQFVVDDGDMLGTDLVEINDGPDRFATEVHKSRRFHSDNAGITDLAAAELAFQVLLDHPVFHFAGFADEVVNTVETDIMPGQIILFTGITKPNQENSLVKPDSIKHRWVTDLGSFL